jgi:hypothetical protein
MAMQLSSKLAPDRIRLRSSERNDVTLENGALAQIAISGFPLERCASQKRVAVLRAADIEDLH